MKPAKKPKRVPPPAPEPKTPDWPAYRVERWPTERLVPYARNARQHSEAQVAQIAAAMREWGWTNPVLVDEAGGIIAGHGRIQAARLLKLPEVPVMVARGWTEPQKRAYVLADNKLAENASWDREMLSGELADLLAQGFEMPLIGFGDDELQALLAQLTVGLNDPDATPELPVDPVACLGDVWILGRHRVACGDSTDALVVERLLAGVKPHLMVTDPPYGVEYDPTWRIAVNSDGPNSTRRTGVVENDDRADWREAWSLFPGNIAYVWHGGLHAGAVAESLAVSGFTLRAQIIWSKQKMVFGRGDYHWQHEPCWYAVKGTGNWAGDRKQTTVWQIDNLNRATKQSSENERTNHSTQKPVECMKRPMENNSSPGQAVYDPFLGSGTTLIAAEMTGRVCYGCELNPAYVDVIVQRWEEFTGQKATREEA